VLGGRLVVLLDRRLVDLDVLGLDDGADLRAICQYTRRNGQGFVRGL
jgi:hypothetical protein